MPSIALLLPFCQRLMRGLVVLQRGFQSFGYDDSALRKERGVRYPDGIFSYASASDGGRGMQHMYAIGNMLRRNGITTYCGKMVQVENWQVQWYGKMAQAKFAIIMLSEAYWKSQPCIDEIVAILQNGKISIFIVRVDESCSTCTRGFFLGETEELMDRAGFIKSKLTMNCFPPPDKPTFQGTFSRRRDCHFADTPPLHPY